MERRKAERRTLDQYVERDRRLCERREQIAAEAAKSGLHAINRFRERQRHTRGLDLNAIHLTGAIV
jgi:hypothetical protein